MMTADGVIFVVVFVRLRLCLLFAVVVVVRVLGVFGDCLVLSAAGDNVDTGWGRGQCRAGGAILTYSNHSHRVRSWDDDGLVNSRHHWNTSRSNGRLASKYQPGQ